MPAVTAPTRVDQNGQSSTNFVDSVGTTVTTYTYPVQQNRLIVVNNGSVAMTLTVNGTNYTIQGGASQTVSSPFTAFAISAVSGTQSFIAAAEAGSSSGGGGSGSGVPTESVETNAGNSAKKDLRMLLVDALIMLGIDLQNHTLTKDNPLPMLGPCVISKVSSNILIGNGASYTSPITDISNYSKFKIVVAPTGNKTLSSFSFTYDLNMTNWQTAKSKNSGAPVSGSSVGWIETAKIDREYPFIRVNATNASGASDSFDIWIIGFYN